MTKITATVWNKDAVLLPLKWLLRRWGEDQVGSYSQAGNIFRATLVHQGGNKMTVGMLSLILVWDWADSYSNTAINVDKLGKISNVPLSHTQKFTVTSIQQEPNRFKIQKSSTNSDVLSLQESDLRAKHHQNVSTWKHWSSYLRNFSNLSERLARVSLVTKRLLPFTLIWVKHSDTILKPLPANDTDHLVKMKCSAWKHRFLAIMWILRHISHI